MLLGIFYQQHRSPIYALIEIKSPNLEVRWRDYTQLKGRDVPRRH